LLGKAIDWGAGQVSRWTKKFVIRCERNVNPKSHSPGATAGRVRKGEVPQQFWGGGCHLAPQKKKTNAIAEGGREKAWKKKGPHAERRVRSCRELKGEGGEAPPPH